jgi:hypothetical protein
MILLDYFVDLKRFHHVVLWVNSSFSHIGLGFFCFENFPKEPKSFNGISLLNLNELKCKVKLPSPQLPMVVLNSFNVVMMCKSLPKTLEGGDCSTSYNKHVFFPQTSQKNQKF